MGKAGKISIDYRVILRILPAALQQWCV